MGFDQLLGAGRSPQVRNAISTVRLKADNVGMAANGDFPAVANTFITSLEAQNKVFSVQVRLFPTSTGVSIDSARFRITIDSYIIADYKLPNSDNWASLVEDTIPVDINTEPGSILKVEYGPELTDTTGYNFGYSVVAYLTTV